MLKLQYSGHLMQRANSLEKTLMLGKIEGRRRRRRQRMRWLDGITMMDMSLSKLRELGTGKGQRSLAGYSLWDHKESDTTEQLSLPYQTMLITRKSRRIRPPNRKMGKIHKVLTEKEIQIALKHRKICTSSFLVI